MFRLRKGTPFWSGPWGRTGSGGEINRGPRLLVLEQHGAQVVERRVQAAPIVDALDESGEMVGDVLAALEDHRVSVYTAG